MYAAEKFPLQPLCVLEKAIGKPCLKEASRKFYGFISYFDQLRSYIILEGLKLITGFYENRDEYSETYITFMSFLRARKNKKTHSPIQGDFIYSWLNINKTKVDIYRQVLTDVSITWW